MNTTFYENCHSCDIVMPSERMCQCLDCNYRFCSPTCGGFKIALTNDVPPKDIAFFAGTGYHMRNCVICRGEEMNDTISYGYLLEVLGMSRENAQQLIRGHILNGGMHRSK